MIRFGHLKSRILCLVLCLACLVCLAIPAQAAGSAASGSSYSVSVHSHGWYGSPVIGQFENGTKITILGQTRDFYRIDCFERNGYIAKDHVAFVGEDTYVNCKPGSSETLTLNCVPMAEALLLRASVLDLGSRHYGDPYVPAARGPHSFDCSGFTDFVFKHNGIQLSRTADTQLRDGIIVPRDSLQVGDLVFFREPGSPWLATHVGIYAGNGRFLHASSSRGIRFDFLNNGYFGPRYIGARRVVNVSTEGIEQAPNAILGMAPMARTVYGIRTAD